MKYDLFGFEVGRKIVHLQDDFRPLMV